MGSPAKKLTVTVEGIEPGKLRGQRIAKAGSRRAHVEFDLIGDTIRVSEGDKIVFEFYTSKPSSLDKFIFCGQGYVTSKPEEDFTMFSVWGILFKFKPSLGLEPETKYYLCIRRIK